MATNISRALLLSATANSATPFLYQTRTLGPVLRSFQRPCTPRLQQAYSTRSDDLDPNDEIESNASTEESVTKVTGNQQPLRKNHLRKRGSPAPRHSDTPEQLKSVTSREKAAFNKLLNQLNNDSSSTGEAGTAQGTAEQNAKQNEIADLMKLFGGIVNLNEQQQQQQQKASPGKPSDSTLTGQNTQTPDSITFDTPLSQTASESDDIEDMPMNEAIYTHEELGLPPARSGADRQISMREAVSLVVHQESSRIERALFEAIEGNKGDMAVWEVCKTHIFSMLHYIDGQKSTESSTTTTSNNSVIIPPMIPAGRVITTLYPRALLTAFRLLNTHFPESQLISQFRASIKAQGRASALLGASPELYHEMVYFYWNGCRDLPAVMSLLRDMDLHGVHPSRETIAFLRSVEQQGKAHMKTVENSSESVPGNGPFWDLPPNQRALAELSEVGGWLERYRRRKRSTMRRRRKLF